MIGKVGRYILFVRIYWEEIFEMPGKISKFKFSKTKKIDVRM